MTQIKDKISLQEILVMLGLVLLLAAEGWSGFKVYRLSKEREEIKVDYSVANNITFGVFSIDEWRMKIAEIVDQKIGAFKVTGIQKKELQAKVEAELNALVSKAVREINKPQKSIGGKLKKLAFNALVDEEELREYVPEFARTIVNRVSSPASIKRLKYIATSKIDSLEAQTYDNSEPASVTVNRSVYKKYKVDNAAQFDHTIQAKLRYLQKQTTQYALLMGGFVVLALSLWWLVRKQNRLYTPVFILSILFALVILFTGVCSTIIEVDARIDTLNLKLLGENISFNNQVLFFQSKSILAIVTDLLNEPKPDAVLVGILLLLFVILLPIIRLIGRGIYVCCRTCDKNGQRSERRAVEERDRGHKIGKFLAFDLAKWDMADVMIVGIGMTYIGLNGILQSQLSSLNIREEVLSATTSNDTSLQAGFFIFTGFVIYTIVLSAICKRINKSAI